MRQLVMVRVLAWTSLPGLIGATEWATADRPPLVRMFAFVFGVLVAMKLVVLAMARADGVRVPAARLGWFLLWFGMNPRQFVRRRPTQRDLVGRWLRLGTTNLLAGIAVLLAACATTGWLRMLLVLVGASIAVHFGVFPLLGAWLRTRGFQVPLLFDAPWRAGTAAEFWARRWNHGFAEMTAVTVQRPLERRFGRERALLAAFVWSGLLHEVVLSLPVRAGWGLPTLYFLLQGLFVRWQGNRRSRAATLAAIVLPLPLVFHPWFLAGVLGG